MKTIKIFLFVLLSIGCKAQNAIVPLNNYHGMYEEPNTYYHDSDNEFNKFVGTWKWEQGLSSITITLQKKLSVLDQDTYNYFDLLVGEYKFIDDTGTIVINTLPNLLNNSIGPFNRNIWGYHLSLARPGNPLTPNNATTNIEYRRVDLNIQDPLRPYLDEVLRIRYIDDATPKIEAYIGSGGMQILEEGQLPDSRCPVGFYTLTKQS